MPTGSDRQEPAPDRLDLAARLLVRGLLAVVAVWLAAGAHALLSDRVARDPRPELVRALGTHGLALVPTGLPARAPEAFPDGYDVRSTPGLPGSGFDGVPAGADR